MTRLFTVGLSHRTAPVELRESVDFSRGGAGEALAALAGRGISKEMVVLSTCNRAEIYAVASDPLRETGRYLAELSGGAGIVATPRSELRALAQLRFIPARPGQLLAVLVFNDGTVETRFIPVEVHIRTPTQAAVSGDGLEGRVVTLGQQLLEDGSAVTIPQDEADALTPTSERSSGPGGAP